MDKRSTSVHEWVRELEVKLQISIYNVVCNRKDAVKLKYDAKSTTKRS